MDVCVVGTGYVGLVTGTCLAHLGHRVVCVDNNAAKVELMQSGRSPIFEPDLETMMQSAMADGYLRFTTGLGEGMESSEVVFIAVGTPALPTGESDTRYVEMVAREIGTHLDGQYRVIVNKSTVPIGSGDWVRRLILDSVEDSHSGAEGGTERIATIAASFDVVSNPEFLREGSAVYDTFNPDRIVLGSTSQRAIALMKDLYAPLIHRVWETEKAQSPVPVVETDLSSAEMIKYAANAFLATKISFINEVANICDRVGADVTQVALGIGLDSRIGPKFLQAGIGWGGSCFPKDVSALIHTAQDYGYSANLMQAAVLTNEQQRLLVLEKLQQVLKVLKGKTIGLLGLTFKPNTDDMRDAPSLNLIEHLCRLGARVKAYDPIINSNGDGTHPLLAQVTLTANVKTLAKDCDALVLVTDWPQFRDVDYAQLAQLMALPIMVDGRNCLDSKALARAGFYYIGVGRPSAGQFPQQSLLSLNASLGTVPQKLASQQLVSQQLVSQQLVSQQPILAAPVA